MTLFPQLEQQLVSAAAQQAEDAPARRATWRERLRRRATVPLLTSGALLATGTAIAATLLWQPIFGADGDHPSVREGAPAQAGLLAVLRRPATAADRGDAVQRTLSHVGGRVFAGVYPETVRHVGANGTEAVVLFAADRFGDGKEEDYSVASPLCVAFPAAVPTERVSANCWTPAQIERNEATIVAGGSGGEHRIGLVPDGVAEVVLHARDGTVLRQAVHDNFYAFANPEGRDVLTGATITWAGAGGSAIEPSGGGR